MMKRLLITALLSLLFLPAPAFAGTCPTRANDLREFRNCMVPLRGTVGTASIYKSAQYDADHRALMAAMARGSGVPPQVMPMAATGPYPFIGAYNPYYAMASAYMYGFFRINTPYAVNPYWYGYSR